MSEKVEKIKEGDVLTLKKENETLTFFVGKKIELPKSEYQYPWVAPLADK